MAPITKTLCFLYFMNEKFTKNAKVQKFTNMLGIAVRLIVIDPYATSCHSYPELSPVVPLGLVSKSSRLSAVSVKLRAPNSVRGALRRRPIVWTISRLRLVLKFGISASHISYRNKFDPSTSSAAWNMEHRQ